MMRGLARALLLAIAVLPGLFAAARAETPDAALEALLAQARSECAQPGDRLARVLCGGRLRAGVREY